MLTIPDSPEPEQTPLRDPLRLATPAVAVERSFTTTADMAEMGRQGVCLAIGLMHKWDEKKASEVNRLEAETDRYEDAIGTYLVHLSNRSMNLADSHMVNTLLHTISDFERIGDHADNLAGYTRLLNQRNISFSPEAQQEITAMRDICMAGITQLLSPAAGSVEWLTQVSALEQRIDDMTRE